MSFQQGVSGLSVAGKNLEVIGHNVANASTVGAKASRAEFADIYARVEGRGGVNIGLGVQLASVSQAFSQGNLSSSNNPLDVAINGAGFFQMEDAGGSLLYSRNGQFRVDREGYVSNAQGQRLIGIPATYAEGQIPGKASALQLATRGVDPKVTSKISMEINLDSRSTITGIEGTVPMVDLADARTYNNSTSINVYDVKGQSVTLTYFFQKTAPDSWNVYVAANGEALNTDDAGFPQPITQAIFSPDGKSPTSPSGPFTIDVPRTAAGQYNSTEPIEGVKVDWSSLSQYGTPFGPTALSQDGFAPGRLTAISVETDGNIMATYSNGQSASLARVELANFRNPQGLRTMGGNTWSATYDSGDAVIGKPGGGNLGLLQSRALEDSNIDLTTELVNMMVAQRIYQANAQTIKTTDQVLQTLVNLR